MQYNLTNVTGASNYFDMTVEINNAIGGIIYLGILFALAVLLFVVMLKWGALRSGATSILITGTSGILLILAGAISINLVAWFIIPMAMSIGALFIAYKNQNTE